MLKAIRRAAAAAVSRHMHLRRIETMTLTAGASLARAVPALKEGASLAVYYTRIVNSWTKSIWNGKGSEIEESPCYSLLHNKFQLPRSVASLFGPILPRPEFLAALDERLANWGSNAMFLGPSNLGKTTFLVHRMAKGGVNNDLGLTGVLYVSLRSVSDEEIYEKFFHQVAIDTKNKSHTDVEFEFQEVCERFYIQNGRKPILLLDDLHTSSLQTLDRMGRIALKPMANQLMGKLVNLTGVLQTLITASDPIAIKVLRSGATARFDLVNFPATDDRHLTNGLLGVVTDKNGDIYSLDLSYMKESYAFDIDLEECLLSQDPAHSVCRVFASREEVNYVVNHVGSHYGDLCRILKAAVAAHKAGKKHEPAVKESVETIVSTCQQFLVEAVEDVDPIFALLAYRSFEALSKVAGGGPCDVSEIITTEELISYKVPFNGQHRALERLASMNLITFPSFTEPWLFGWCHRSLSHAWSQVKDKRVVQEAVMLARKKCESS